MKNDLSWEEARKFLERRLQAHKIKLNLNSFWPALKKYLLSFEKEAQHLKLTASQTRREFFSGPLFDSLFLASCLPEGVECADLGTGAGIPGFIIKLARPDLHLHLLEAYYPRVNFIKGLIRKLGLKGIEVYRCHLGFEECKVKAPVTIGRGYGAVEKFVFHAANFIGSEKAFYLWRKDVEPWRQTSCALELAAKIPLPARPVELLIWKKV